MSAHLTDSRPHRSAFPNDLRDTDPRPRVSEADKITAVLNLVELVCGPDSDVAHMLTDKPSKRKAVS